MKIELDAMLSREYEGNAAPIKQFYWQYLVLMMLWQCFPRELNARRREFERWEQSVFTKTTIKLFIVGVKYILFS